MDNWLSSKANISILRTDIIRLVNALIESFESVDWYIYIFAGCLASFNLDNYKNWIILFAILLEVSSSYFLLSF